MYSKEGKFSNNQMPIPRHSRCMTTKLQPKRFGLPYDSRKTGVQGIGVEGSGGCYIIVDGVYTMYTTTIHVLLLISTMFSIIIIIIMPPSV